jgi:hypothetical protein
MKHWLLVSAALLAISASAYADETLKYRIIYHITAIQSQEAPDTNGHVISLVRTSGLASMPTEMLGLTALLARLIT